MKFTQNTSIMNPNTINAQYRAVTDPMAYGTAGKDYEAMAGALGQVVKFAQQKQDEHDTSDLMQARNEIMGNITNQMYGEKGLMTLGVGENAQGLQDRVTKTIQDTFDKISKKYNPRVRKALKGNLNENMANYQRLAGQQEGREYVKMQDVNYSSGQAMNLDRAVAGYQDDTTLGVTLEDSLRMLHGYAALKGWSGAQIQEEERKIFSTMGGGAIQAAMDNNDLVRADILTQRYGPYMDQTTKMKFDVALKKNSDIQESRTMGGDLVKKFGKNKQAAYDYVFNDLAKLTETVSSAGGYSDDRFVRIAQKTAELIYKKFPDASPNLAAYLYGQMMHESAWGQDPKALEYNNFAGLHGGAEGRKYKDDDDYAADYASFFTDGYHTQAIYATDGTDFARRLSNKLDGGSGWYEDRNYQAYGNTVTEAMKDYAKKAKSGSGSAVAPYQMPTQGASIDEQVGNLKDTWKHGVMDWVGGVVKDVFGYSNPTISSAARSSARNAQVSTSGDRSWHVHNDALDVVFDEGQNLTQDQKDALVKYFEDTGMFSEVLYHDYGSGWHLHLGGLKSSNPPQGGGSGYNKRKYSEAQLQAIYRQYEAQLSDQIQTENYQKQEQTKAYIEGLKGLGSQSNVQAYLDKVKASADVETYSRVASAAHGYYPEYFSRSRSGGVGSSGGRGRTTYVQGDDGRKYTKSKIEWAQDVYNEYLDDDNITEAEQKRYNKATRILTATGYGKGDNLDNPMAFTVAKQAWDQTQDYGKAHKWLQDVYDFSFNEATYYLDHLD